MPGVRFGGASGEIGWGQGWPNEYRYRGRWVPMSTESEEIPVRGGALETAEMTFTRHGPVI